MCGVPSFSKVRNLIAFSDTRPNIRGSLAMTRAVKISVSELGSTPGNID